MAQAATKPASKFCKTCAIMWTSAAMTAGSIWFVAWRTQPESWSKKPTENQRLQTFNRVSKFIESRPLLWQYDEILLQMGKYRQKLINKAGGKVLEVAAGTGNNLEYYINNTINTGNGNGKNGKSDNNTKIKPIDEIYFVDKSPEMIDELKSKTSSMKLYNRVNNRECSIKCDVSDSENLGYDNDKFDCVIDTFGLCSYEHPKDAVSEMVRVCKPGQKLLLLERGMSDWRIVQMWQNKNMLKNANKWGRYLNRDILGLIDQRDDVEITRLERRHFGTTYYVEAKKLGKEEKKRRNRIEYHNGELYNNGEYKGMDINVMVQIA